MHVPDHILQFAIREARKSPSNKKHGAVSFSRGIVLHRGFNKPILASQKRQCSFHAEIGAVHHLPKKTFTSPVDMVVVRVSPGLGLLGPSRPCGKCIKMLKRFGVRIVWFSTEQGDLDWINLKAI